MSGSDLFTGTLDILILKTLRGRALHGYAIGRWIRDHSQGVLSVEEVEMGGGGRPRLAYSDADDRDDYEQYCKENGELE